MNKLDEENKKNDLIKNLPLKVACPICKSKMDENNKFKSSKVKYYSCSNCNIKFKEQNNKFRLQFAPKNSRVGSYYKNKELTWDEWHHIGLGNYTNEEIEELSHFIKKEDNILNYKCPVCNKTNLDHLEIPNKYRKSPDYLVCPECGVRFEVFGKNKLKFVNFGMNDFILWDYYGKIMDYDKICDILHPDINEVQLSSYSEINNVDLYETRAVRHNIGGSYGKKGARVYAGTSDSIQEWKNLGRGTLTLVGDKIFFIGSGESRTIELNKINQIITDSNELEISVSNRQKTMRFVLSGRTHDDAMKLKNAILNGETSVLLPAPASAPSGCYIATFVYGDYNAKQVLFLRDFRDNILLHNIFGKIFVNFYYKTSPVLIKHFGNSIFKKTSKIILDNIIKILK